MIICRQSTARTVTIGPVLDADGVAVTNGVVADFKIAKNGGAPAALNASATLTHRNTGHYSLALTASDLDTVGQTEIVIDDTVNACPMKEITVIEEAVYDALFAASAAGYVAASALPANFAALGINASGHVSRVTLVDSTTANTDMLSAAGVRSAVGLASANLDTQLSTIDDFLDTEVAAILAAVDTEVAAIKAKTDNLPVDPADESSIQAAVAAVSAFVDTEVAAIKSDTAAILLDTGTDGVVVAAASKSGYALSASGLDTVSTTAPLGVASNYREMMVQLWRRFFKKSTLTSTDLKTYADNGTDVVTTQAVTDSAGTQTQGAAS